MSVKKTSLSRLIGAVLGTARQASPRARGGRFQDEAEIGTHYVLSLEASAEKATLLLQDQSGAEEPLEINEEFRPPADLTEDALLVALRGFNNKALHVLEGSLGPPPITLSTPKPLSSIYDPAYAYLEESDSSRREPIILDPGHMG